MLPRLASLAGFLGKVDALDGKTAVIAITTTDSGHQYTLTLGEKVSLATGAPASADGTLTLPAEALTRLVTGRLKDPYPVPAGLATTGAADLDLLRKVFPKF
jgi:hypothetical protein